MRTMREASAPFSKPAREVARAPVPPPNPVPAAVAKSAEPPRAPSSERSPRRHDVSAVFDPVPSVPFQSARPRAAPAAQAGVVIAAQLPPEAVGWAAEPKARAALRAMLSSDAPGRGNAAISNAPRAAATHDPFEPPPLVAGALTLNDVPEHARVLRSWEQPAAMAEPVARSLRPGARARVAQPLQHANPMDTLPDPQPVAAAPAAAGRPLQARPPAQPVASVAPPARAVDTRTFWESLGSACLLPFTGPGVFWIVTIAAWSIAASLLSFLAGFALIAGITVTLFANSSLLAIACDYFRVCFWSPLVGEDALDVAPEFDPARIMNRYIKSGLHLMLFTVISQVPLIGWLASNVMDGEPLLDLLTHPITWILIALPYVYWPMGVALTALSNDFATIWNIPAGMRAIGRAPLEYALVVVVAIGSFMASWGVLLFFGGMMGVAGALLGSTLGIPLAISHGLQGALMGHLARARSDVFE